MLFSKNRPQDRRRNNNADEPHYRRERRTGRTSSKRIQLQKCIQNKNYYNFGGRIDRRPSRRNKKATTIMIDTPDPFDVLFARGRPIQNHPGNMLLRLLIDQNCHRYNKAPRLEKSAIAKEIVQGIKSNNGKLPGRFLRRCGGDSSRRGGTQGKEGWKEVSDHVAIDKVSHCFRARKTCLAQRTFSSFSSFSGGGSSSSLVARMMET